MCIHVILGVSTEQSRSALSKAESKARLASALITCSHIRGLRRLAQHA